MLHIIGSPRSGTTIFAQCLNAHSNICIPHDLDFFLPVSVLLDGVKNEQTGRKVILEFLLGMDSFERSLGEYLYPDKIVKIIHDAEYSVSGICNAILFEIAKKEQKRIFGYKSTKNIDQLAILWLRQKFSYKDQIVHIIRDGRDVLTSLVSVGWVNPRKTCFGSLWASQNILINKLLRHSHNYHLVKYEDFAANPQIELEIVCERIGVDYESLMIDKSKRSARYRTMQNIHDRIYSDINDNGVGAWKEMPANLLKNFTNQTLEGLRHFEYPV